MKYRRIGPDRFMKPRRARPGLNPKRRGSHEPGNWPAGDLPKEGFCKKGFVMSGFVDTLLVCLPVGLLATGGEGG